MQIKNVCCLFELSDKGKSNAESQSRKGCKKIWPKLERHHLRPVQIQLWTSEYAKIYSSEQNDTHA